MPKQGQLGTVTVVLPEWLDPEGRYNRVYVPVTPASRVVTGADDQIAPETDIATWSITDWSAGEGDLRWRDRDRYNVSTGNGPVSDGSGITVGHDWAVATGQTAVIARGTDRLVATRDMDGDLYEWGGSSWSTFWTTLAGTTGDDAVSIAAPTSTAWFVLGEDGDIWNVTSGTAVLHFDASSVYFGVAWYSDLVAFGGNLYALMSAAGSVAGTFGADLYEVDQTTTDTATVVYDSSVHSIAGTRVKALSVSDVGPFWLEADTNGRTRILEYNVAESTGYVVGDLPSDVHAYDLLFHAGIYFVAFRYAPDHASEGDAYLYFQKGEARGTVGPFRADSTTASKRIAIAGVIGDRVMVVFQERLWAYDLSSGGVTLVADVSTSSIGDAYSATTYGSEVFLAGAAHYGVIDTRTFLHDVAQTLSTGFHDYGYLGLSKLVHTVTIATEDVLAASDTVEVGYSVDGGAVTWLSDDFATGTASHQWTVSTDAASVKGTDIEWHIRQTTTSTSVAAKVVALHSDVSGAKSRVEFTVAVDLGESSIVDGGNVLAALKALKTSHTVVEWSDPFQVAEYAAPETFDVRIKEVSSPELIDAHVYAMVRFQTVGVVG